MTIKTVQVLCASCGAALAIPPDLDQISCAHCGTPLTIVHGDGFVAARLAQAVTRTIETSAAATQAELRRLQLQQERFSLQERIADLEAEERAMRRAGQTGIPFLPGPLTEVQREWNHTVARLGEVEDALGEPRSYHRVPRRPLLSWPPDARGWGLIIMILGVLCVLVGALIGRSEILFGGVLIAIIGYGVVAAFARR